MTDAEVASELAVAEASPGITKAENVAFMRAAREGWPRALRLVAALRSARKPAIAAAPLDLDRLRDDVHRFALERADGDDLAERLILLIQANEQERLTRAALCEDVERTRLDFVNACDVGRRADARVSQLLVEVAQLRRERELGSRGSGATDGR